MELYPLYLNLKGKKCLVVGGGRVAERKVDSLLRCGARVQVVSPDLTGGLQALAQSGQINYRRGVYEPGDLDGAFLVISATDNGETNKTIAGDCAGRNIMVNIVDDPEKCSFFVPSVVHRGPLKIAVSTGGQSPGMAKAMRKRLEKQISPQFAAFTDFLGDMRNKILNEINDPGLRKRILSSMVDEYALDMVEQGDLAKAKERVINNVHHKHWCQS